MRVIFGRAVEDCAGDRGAPEPHDEHLLVAGEGRVAADLPGRGRHSTIDAPCRLATGASDLRPGDPDGIADAKHDRALAGACRTGRLKPGERDRRLTATAKTEGGRSSRPPGRNVRGRYLPSVGRAVSARRAAPRGGGEHGKDEDLTSSQG